MSHITWNRLGTREKQLLAILRRADEPLTTRQVLGRINADGDDVAYTTVSTILNRLADKGVVDRDREMHSGKPRYRHSFEAEEYRQGFIDNIVEDVAMVLGDPGLDRLADHADEARNRRNQERTTDNT